MKRAERAAALKSGQPQTRGAAAPWSASLPPISAVTSRFRVPTLKIVARAGQIAPCSRTPADLECFGSRLPWCGVEQSRKVRLNSWNCF